MKHSLLFTLIFILLISKPSFAAFDFDHAIEVDVGLASPGKGLIGVRFWPTQSWSFGAIMGPVPVYGYTDFGLAYSYHFYGANGLYAFQGFHWLNSGKKFGNVIEMDTGAGYQLYGLLGNFLPYAEIGIPLYISDGIYRDYNGGKPRNKQTTLYYKDKDGEAELDKIRTDVVYFSIRVGFGIGYIFSL
jgi:hypothetical protein